MSSVVALRTALVWHDEVMEDLVVEKPTRITLGSTGSSTFTIPSLGLPVDFAIVRPGNRGYLLTLGEKMRGTICLDGEEKSVEDFVARGGEGEGTGNFRATPISGRDWGVIDLDESGDYKLFFQFVPLDEGPTFFTPKVIAGGAAGVVLSSVGMGLARFGMSDSGLLDAFAEGAGISLLAILIAGLIRWLFVQDGESQASFAFSIILHVALLFVTYQLYDGTNEFDWPGPRGMTGRYMVTRTEIEETPPPEKQKTVGAVSEQSAAQKNPNKTNAKTATMGESGAAGGKGDTERARDKVATRAPDAGVMTGAARRYTEDIIDKDLSKIVGRFNAVQGDRPRVGSVGYGPGAGTGVGAGNGTGTTRGGKGKGTGGGGNVDGDFTSSGKIDTGKERPGGNCVGKNCTGNAPREVKVGISSGSGDPGGYSMDEIDRVVKARAGVFRACYQKELNRSPGIGGKISIFFKINGEGTVTAANVKDNTVKNSEVESCVKSNVMRLKFPPKGRGAQVTYPFVFSQGG